MRTKDQFPDMLRTFLLDFRQIFSKFPDLRIMKSDKAKEFNSAEVERIFSHDGIKHQFSASNQQNKDAAERQLVNTKMLFSKAPKILCFWAFKYVCHVKRFLPTSANPGCQSPLQIFNSGQ